MNKKGNFLSVLIVVIIIGLLILSSILQITGNDPLEKARKEKFQEKIESLQKELDKFIKEKKEIQKEDFDITTIIAKRDAKNNTYDLEDIFSDVEDKYLDKIEVKSGKLVFIGKNENEKKWYEEIEKNANVEEQGQNDSKETNNEN